MTDFQRNVINLIKSAVTGEKYPLGEGFTLNSDLLLLGKRQQILPLIYYGAVNCGIDESDAEMQSLFIKVCSAIAKSEQQTYELKLLYEMFDKNGIEYMPLKGALLKYMYPKPEMRLMGDADILIKTEQYDRIKPIMQDAGYDEILESDHELNWRKQGFLIELHKRLIPSYNKDYYTYFGDGWNLAKKCKDLSCRYEMTDDDNFIFLFTHFAKHYRDAGIGAKHIADLWVYRSQKTLNEDYLKSEFKKLGIEKFYLNTVAVIDAWFSDGPETEVTDFITNVIFGGGAYGTHKAYVEAKALIKSKSHKNVKAFNIFKLVFLPYKYMCEKYKVLIKLPFLLPLFWVVRGFDVVFNKRKKLASVTDDLKLASAENIDNYQKSLNYVGLDFNFKE